MRAALKPCGSEPSKPLGGEEKADGARAQPRKPPLCCSQAEPADSK